MVDPSSVSGNLPVHPQERQEKSSKKEEPSSSQRRVSNAGLEAIPKEKDVKPSNRDYVPSQQLGPELEPQAQKVHEQSMRALGQEEDLIEEEPLPDLAPKAQEIDENDFIVEEGLPSLIQDRPELDQANPLDEEERGEEDFNKENQAPEQQEAQIDQQVEKDQNRKVNKTFFDMDAILSGEAKIAEFDPKSGLITQLHPSQIDKANVYVHHDHVGHHPDVNQEQLKAALKEHGHKIGIDYRKIKSFVAVDTKTWKAFQADFARAYAEASRQGGVVRGVSDKQKLAQSGRTTTPTKTKQTAQAAQQKKIVVPMPRGFVGMFLAELMGQAEASRERKAEKRVEERQATEKRVVQEGVRKEQITDEWKKWTDKVWEDLNFLVQSEFKDRDITEERLLVLVDKRREAYPPFPPIEKTDPQRYRGEFKGKTIEREALRLMVREFLSNQ